MFVFDSSESRRLEHWLQSGRYDRYTTYYLCEESIVGCNSILHTTISLEAFQWCSRCIQFPLRSAFVVSNCCLCGARTMRAMFLAPTRLRRLLNPTRHFISTRGVAAIPCWPTNVSETEKFGAPFSNQTANPPKPGFIGCEPEPKCENMTTRILVDTMRTMTLS
jgi:hypothetical protein